CCSYVTLPAPGTVTDTCHAPAANVNGGLTVKALCGTGVDVTAHAIGSRYESGLPGPVPEAGTTVNDLATPLVVIDKLTCAPGGTEADMTQARFVFAGRFWV